MEQSPRGAKMSRLRRRRPELKRVSKFPHVHTSSYEQWENQYFTILQNLERMKKEYANARGTYSGNLMKGIMRNIKTRQLQLWEHMKKAPLKDRPRDILNNTWMSDSEEILRDVGKQG